MLFLPSYLKESQKKKMSEKTTGDAYMQSKHEEAQQPPPVYPGAGPATMQPPPCYPGYQVPPGQSGQPGVVYQQQGAPLMYNGQPNVVVQYPGGVPGVMAGGQPAPPDHFMMALMVTLFCFCPTGFIALMRASDARTAVARGDLQSATNYSREAKKFINISIGVGILSVILTVALMVLYFFMLTGATRY